MEITRKEKEDVIILHLQGELNIYSVGYLKDELLGVLQEYNKISIDLSQIEEIDTSGFQFLVVLKRTALEKGIQLKFFGHNEKVLRVYAIYGAIGLLGDKIRLTNEEKESLSFRYGLKKQNIEAGTKALI